MDALNWGVCESLGKKVAYFGWYTWTCTYTCMSSIRRRKYIQNNPKRSKKISKRTKHNADHSPQTNLIVGAIESTSFTPLIFGTADTHLSFFLFRYRRSFPLFSVYKHTSFFLFFLFSILYSLFSSPFSRSETLKYPVCSLQSAQTCNVLCLISRRTYKLYLVTSGFPFYFEIPNYILSHPPNLQLNPLHTMRDTPSKFIEILDPKDSSLRMSDSDVRLEDVLADHEATINSRARSSTQSSAKPDKPPSRRNSTSPTPRWKRLSNILGQPRRNS
jgi:hypothetical protein